MPNRKLITEGINQVSAWFVPFHQVLKPEISMASVNDASKKPQCHVHAQPDPPLNPEF